MNASAPPVAMPSAGLDEDVARGEIYGLLAHLYYAAPGADLLATLRDAAPATPGSLLEVSWNALAAAARDLDAAAIQAEYDALYGGVGKPEIYLFGSHYLAGFLNEKPLVRLRDDLAALGLERDPAMPETEDHVAYLCEVMRWLITGPDAAVANLTQQSAFFRAHLQPWVGDLCDAITMHPAARFYAHAADFTRDFMHVEAQGFDMLA
ncbi:TorD/DmsD family molecular chaperone [Bordetella genomosp. 7]|uniref:Molecular chaperone n=1 Tax=Bordetella genomosp. 7 TaxID=1416805 RepID=A0A261QUK3_9BORD|nr:molecular chaperone TorD family protein [Bordetella genomosp. 7]OZI16401.1 hypothetical protein CAL19_17090 [Bordetella genomosp. 7]